VRDHTVHHSQQIRCDLAGRGQSGRFCHHGGQTPVSFANRVIALVVKPGGCAPGSDRGCESAIVHGDDRVRARWGVAVSRWNLSLRKRVSEHELAQDWLAGFGSHLPSSLVFAQTLRALSSPQHLISLEAPEHHLLFPLKPLPSAMMTCLKSCMMMRHTSVCS